MTLRSSRAAVLAAGVVHAVFNASNNEGNLVDDLLSGGQPSVLAVTAATVFTAVTLAVVRLRAGRGTPEEIGTAGA